MSQPDARSFTPEPNTLLVEDRLLARGFVQLPKLVLEARNLSRDAKLLYAILLGYAWQAGRCFPGYVRLCKDMQASENMVRKCMRELEAARLLSQKRRGLGMTNLYTLLSLRTAKTEVLEPQDREVLDPPKTAGEIDAGKEEGDYDLRNSKATAAQREQRQSRENASPPAELDHIGSHPPRLHHTTSRSRPFHGLERVDAALARAHPRPVAARPLTAQSTGGRPAVEPGLEALAVAITEISRDFGDMEHLRSNFTQATRILQRSQLEESIFVSKLYEARAITKDRQRSPSSAAGSAPLLKPMAYFWRVVRHELGMAEDSDEAGTAPNGAGGPTSREKEEK